jgi:DUF1365 family protein
MSSSRVHPRDKGRLHGGMAPSASSGHPEPDASTARPRPLASAVYMGWVRHRRFAPIERAFTFPLYMLYVDLDEVDAVFARQRLWARDAGRRRLALGRFTRSDYLGDPSRELKEEVICRVALTLGFKPAGAVRLLTHARQYGYVFNPVSFYYCFSERDTSGGEQLLAIVAEITNTPWKDRHAYVLDCRTQAPHACSDAAQAACGSSRPRRFNFEKIFHVSPFLPMGLAYDWSFSVPCPQSGSRLGVHMTLRETERSASVDGPDARATPGRRAFDATLRLERRPIGPRTLDGMLLRFPLLTARVFLAIHLHALRLWLRRVPVFPRPSRSGDPPAPPRDRPGSQSN